MQLTSRPRRSLSHSPFDWMLDDFFGFPATWEDASSMRGIAADVYQTDDNVVVKMAVPGMNPDDISIQISGDTLTISGETSRDQMEEGVTYLQKQLYAGKFTQMLTLPERIDADKAEAKFEQGILVLTMPKSEELKPRTIKVTTNESAKPKLLK